MESGCPLSIYYWFPVVLLEHPVSTYYCNTHFPVYYCNSGCPVVLLETHFPVVLLETHFPVVLLQKWVSQRSTTATPSGYTTAVVLLEQWVSSSTTATSGFHILLRHPLSSSICDTQWVPVVLLETHFPCSIWKVGVQ